MSILTFKGSATRSKGTRNVSTAKVTLNDGRECRVTLSRSLQGASAHSLMFAPNSSDIESETTETLYMEYCRDEIVYSEISKLAEGILDASDVWDDLESQGIPCCSCEMDDDDE